MCIRDRVRRRQERAGHARGAHLRSRGAVAQRHRHRLRRHHHRKGRSGHQGHPSGHEGGRHRAVLHRRLRRGRPCCLQAVQRVAGGQRDHGSQTGRQRDGERSPGLQEVQGPGHRESLTAPAVDERSEHGGDVFADRRAKLSLRVASWELLSKSLRPMPEKFHGLTDVEPRYRRRYLDLMVNDASREVFVKRARIIRAIREFLDGRGFVEVETPVLQPLYGGALARPFTTHHNELERDLYLRIATELYLKRCIIGGIDRVYEMGQDFRNEGVSYKHNPEFTMLETYEAYVDYNHVMDMVEQMVVEAACAVGDLKVAFRDHVIDLTPPWPRLTMRKAIENETGIDIGEIRDVPALQAAIREHGFDGVTLAPTWGLQVDELFSEMVEPKLIQPVFITEHPLETSPFAKRTPHDPRFVCLL